MKKDLLVSTIGFKQNDKVVELVASAPRNLVTSFFDNSRMLVPEVVSSLDSLSKQDIINFEELQNLLEKSNNPLVFDAVRNFFELYTYQRVKVQPLESFYKIRSAVAKFGTEKDIVDFGKLDSSLEQNSEFLNKVISMGIIQSEKPKVKELI
ncbi:MAG: hypothetical protein J6A17_02935 [Bacilli bacterium]|nr:hypothetical protein [Bacilli bacterium]